MVSFTVSSCSCCSAQQLLPVLLCSHQRALTGISVVSSSSSSMWAFPFYTHNQTWCRLSHRNLITSMEPYLTAKPKPAERIDMELLRCRAAAEPKQKPKEEKLELPDFFEIDQDSTAAFNLLFESEQILKTARHYEVVFLVHEDHVEQLQDIIQKVKDFIEEKKGKVYRLNDWGLRKLAYKIKKTRRANYILMNFQIDAKEINEFKSLLDMDERIIRHLVITMKKAETKETVPPPEFSSIRDEEDLDEEYEEGELEESEVEDEEEELEESEVEDEGEDDSEEGQQGGG